MSPAAARAAAPARKPAAARTTARAGAPARVPRRPALRVVTPVPSRAPRAPFVLFAMLLVGAGLVSLLVLNTVVAQDAFTLHDLAASNAELAEREQLLRQDVAALEAPNGLADRAGKLGLVAAGDPVFLTPDGRVLGNPKPVEAPPPPPAPPAPKVSATPAPKASVAAKPAAKPAPKPSASVKP